MENSRETNRDLRRESGGAESLGHRNSGEQNVAPRKARLPAGLRDFAVESGKFRFGDFVVESENSPSKRMKGMSTEKAIKLKGQSARVKVAERIDSNEPKKKRVAETDQNKQQHDDFRVSNPSPLQNFMALECSEGLRLEQFGVGDIVWARFDRRKDSPAWPAKVIDPKQDAPESVQSDCVPGRLCVKFFCMENRWDRAYAWVKEEMMFHFSERLEELAYEGQEVLEKVYKRRKGEFLEAVEEAFAADFSSEYRVMQNQDSHQGGETICSSCSKKFPASELLQSVKVKQRSNSSKNGALICRLCCKLYEHNQYCGICMKVCRSPTLKRCWVQCQNCKIWVHADCDNISNEQLRDLIEYSCPQCILKQPALGTALKEKINKLFTVPERITVVCNGKQADYVTRSHLILCACSECGKGKSMSLSRWDKHVGSNIRKWKLSVIVGGSNELLFDWLNKFYKLGVRGLGFFNEEGKTPIRARERELTGWLLEQYEPIKETWTAERCAICRRVEDSPHDRIIVCNGCNIGVHQNCSGVTDSLDSWVCTACQRAKTEIKPQCCCLCPVMGGALKPTTTPGFWVHVTCACFNNQVTFLNYETMEPVDGILKISPASFRKRCVVCDQVHGSCIKCLHCQTFYHATCALRKGYHMELLYCDYNEKKVCSYISYCASHKVPDQNVGLIIPNEQSVSVPNQNEVAPVILIHSDDSSDESNQNEAATVIHLEDSSDGSSSEDDNNLTEDGLSKIDEPYTSRCCVYNPLKKKSGISSIVHRPMGYSHHTREVIDSRLKQEQEVHPPQFSSYKERLSYSHKTEKNRVCFGKSGVHGYGLFAIKHIRGGDMVIEYRGDIIRDSVADVREKRHHSHFKHSTYFFTIDKETVIDATMKGNVARLINHSCEANCFSRILAFNGVDSRIAIFAKKDIEAGEEITYDYRLSKGDIKERCRCGVPTCRKFMQEYP